MLFSIAIPFQGFKCFHAQQLVTLYKTLLRPHSNLTDLVDTDIIGLH